MGKKLNIGIDIDDTITDTYYNLLPIIAIKYNLDLDKLYKKKYPYGTFHKKFPNFMDFSPCGLLKKTFFSPFPIFKTKNWRIHEIFI